MRLSHTSVLVTLFIANAKVQINLSFSKKTGQKKESHIRMTLFSVAGAGIEPATS